MDRTCSDMLFADPTLSRAVVKAGGFVSKRMSQAQIAKWDRISANGGQAYSSALYLMHKWNVALANRTESESLAKLAELQSKINAKKVEDEIQAFATTLAQDTAPITPFGKEEEAKKKRLQKKKEAEEMKRMWAREQEKKKRRHRSRRSRSRSSSRSRSRSRSRSSSSSMSSAGRKMHSKKRTSKKELEKHVRNTMNRPANAGSDYAATLLAETFGAKPANNNAKPADNNAKPGGAPAEEAEEYEDGEEDVDPQPMDVSA